MNAKPDEHLDRRIRQALDSLPDAPPPGSSFDSGRLWEQLRPELVEPQSAVQKQPHRRAWWFVAAALASLLIGWWIWPLTGSREQGLGQRTTAQRSKEQSRPFAVEKALPQEQPTEQWATNKLEPHTQRRNPIGPALVPSKKRQTTAPNQPAENTVESTAVALETTSIINNPQPTTVASPASTSAVASAPKRRFRIVHENELAAEEEANLVKYRTERFVRLGTSSQVSSGPDEAPPAITLPLSRKSTQ